MFWSVSRKVGPVRIGVGGRFRSSGGGRRSGPTQTELRKQEREEFLDSTQSQFDSLVHQYSLVNGYLELKPGDDPYRSIGPIAEQFEYIQRLVRDGGALTANRKEKLLNSIYFMEERVARIQNPSPLFGLWRRSGSYDSAGKSLLVIAILIIVVGIFINARIGLAVAAVPVLGAIYWYRRANKLRAEMRQLAENISIERNAPAVIPDQSARLAQPKAEPIAFTSEVALASVPEDEPPAFEKQLPVSETQPEIEGIPANLPTSSQSPTDHSDLREEGDAQIANPIPVPALSANRNRSRWNRLVQIALSLIVIALIATGAVNAAATDMRSLWAGIGWALMSIAYITFIGQFLGFRPLLRHVHAAILIPLFVIALVIVAANSAESSTAEAIFGLVMPFSFFIVALLRGVFVLIAQLRRMRERRISRRAYELKTSSK